MGLDFQAFGQSLQKIGKNMMQTAMFYGQSKMALHQSEFGFGSIWGGGYGGYMGGGSIWGCGCGGYMGGCYGMNMYNQQTLNFAYQQGYNEIAMRMQNVHNGTSGLSGTIPVEHTNNPAASAVPQGIDTKFGKAYEEAEKNQQSFNFIKPELAEITDANEKKTVYNQTFTELGQSLLANVDKNSGNQDGYITLEEFLKNEKADTDATKKANMQKVFNQLDQNGDGKVDYKELTAMLAMYDANSDGGISKEEFNKGDTSLINGTATKSLQDKYNELFPKKTITTTEEE